MKRQNLIIALLVLVILYLYFGRRVSGLDPCPIAGQVRNAAGICQTVSTTTTVSTSSKTSARLPR